MPEVSSVGSLWVEGSGPFPRWEVCLPQGQRWGPVMVLVVFGDGGSPQGVGLTSAPSGPQKQESPTVPM